MNKDKCLLLCSHEYVEVLLGDKDFDEIYNENFNEHLFQHFIWDNCTKILIRVGENVDVNVNWICAGDCFQWSRKSVDLLVSLYKTEYLNHKCIKNESWEAIEAAFIKCGYKVTAEQCREEIKTLLLLHTRIKLELECVADDSDEWFYFHVVDDLLHVTTGFPRTHLKCGNKTNDKMEKAAVLDVTQNISDLQLTLKEQLSPNPESSKQRVENRVLKSTKREFTTTEILREKRANAHARNKNLKKSKNATSKTKEEKRQCTPTQQIIFDLTKEQNRLHQEVYHLLNRHKAIDIEIAEIKQCLQI